MDAQLRRAESAWRAAGTLEAEVEVLRQRLRAGRIAWPDVLLACRFGREAAVAVAREAGRLTRSSYGDDIYDALVSHGQRAYARYLYLVAAQYWEFWQGGPGPPNAELFARLQAGLEAVEAWTDCPCAPHADLVAAEAEAGWGRDLYGVEPKLRAAALAVTAAAGDDDALHAARQLQHAPRLVGDLHRRMSGWLVGHGAG